MQPPLLEGRAPGASPARFEATSAARPRTGWIAVLGLNGVVILWAGLAALLPDATAKALAPLGIVAFLVASVAYVYFLARTRPVRLDVAGEQLLVDEGRGGAFPLAGARLGPWRDAFGVSGAVLHLAAGKRAFRVGAREHRAAVPVHLEAPPSADVHASLPREAFVALLARLGLPTVPPDGPRVLRCLLMPNPSASGGFRVMLPWLGTIVLVALVAFGLDAVGLTATPFGRDLTTGITIALVIGGIVLTVVLGNRRGRLEIEIDGPEVRLRNARTGRVLAAAPRPWVGHSCAMWRFAMRGTSYAYPAIVVTIPSHAPITFCTFDPGFAWPGAVPSVGAPRYVMGALDWRDLVEELDLHRAPREVAR
jgi:hypothetical protein